MVCVMVTIISINLYTLDAALISFVLYFALVREVNAFVCVVLFKKMCDLLLVTATIDRRTQDAVSFSLFEYFKCTLELVFIFSRLLFSIVCSIHILAGFFAQCFKLHFFHLLVGCFSRRRDF